MHVCKGRENKRSIWLRTLASFHLLLLKSLLPCSLGSSRTTELLNNDNVKQANNHKRKKYTKQYLNTKEAVLKDSTRRYKHESAKIA
jgi:hypothetical protein